VEFREKYVFADVAEKMVIHVEQKLKKGEYDSIIDLGEFTAQLRQDLRSLSHDRHIKILPGQILPLGTDVNSLRKENFGFKAVDILPGNIGYLNFNQFYDPKDAGPTAIAAMNFLAACDALIIDLRENGGGYTELSQIICSYFFDESVCLAEHHHRDGMMTQDWTLRFVPGPRMTKVPIYILLSRASFSCAEGFAFSLKNLGRATIIGEETLGGAHFVKEWYFPSESITLFIPYAETVDPKTKKTFEATGIQPDIRVPANKALPAAMIEAARALLKGNPDEGQKFLLEWVLKDYEVQLKPVGPNSQILREYVGRYGSYQVTLEYDRLYFHLNEDSKERLVPIADDDFKIIDENKNGYSAYRVQFTRDSFGKVIELYLHDHDGDRNEAKKRDGSCQILFSRFAQEYSEIMALARIMTKGFGSDPVWENHRYLDELFETSALEDEESDVVLLKFMEGTQSLFF
jgi:retinol-binding protein 3